VTGKVPYVGYWVHNGTMQLDGVKMSKSLGNLVKVHELLDEGYSADAVRLVLLSTHYREDRDFSRDQLASAEQDVALFRRAADSTNDGAEQLRAQPFRNAFMDAMDNDLDTPGAIAALRQLAEEIESGQVAATTGAPALRELASVLGLTLGREE